ncbi:hypothetical protein TWF696_001472 [Orbilia brochopaga]|uniref:Uncharacterized protein n=1 Tax=Orbilia brochopaga TaxID=3140254 RepID=A0AAV9U8S1_9PEZI
MNDYRIIGRTRKTETLCQRQTTKEREPQLKRRNLPPSSITPDPHRYTKHGRITKDRLRKISGSGTWKPREPKSPADRHVLEENGQGGLQALLPTAVGASGGPPSDSDGGTGNSMSVAVSSTDGDGQDESSDRSNDAEDVESEDGTESETEDGMEHDVAIRSTPTMATDSGDSDWSQAQTDRADIHPPHGIQAYLREPESFLLRTRGEPRSRDIYLHDQRGMPIGPHLESLVAAIFPLGCKSRHRGMRGGRMSYILHGIGGWGSIQEPKADDSSEPEGPSPPA